MEKEEEEEEEEGEKEEEEYIPSIGQVSMSTFPRILLTTVHWSHIFLITFSTKLWAQIGDCIRASSIARHHCIAVVIRVSQPFTPTVFWSAAYCKFKQFKEWLRHILVQYTS